MKKILFILCIGILSLVAPLSLFSQQEEVWWGSNYMPGNLVFSADLAYESSGSYLYSGIGLYPEAEFIIYKPYLGNISPLDIGAAVRGHIGIAFGGADSPLSAGVGILATLHFSLKGLDFLSPEIVDNVEAFSELGLGFNILKHYAADPGLVFISTSGVRYHLNDSLAVKAGYTNWGAEGGPFIGAHFKLGPGQTVVPKNIDLSAPKLGMPTIPYVQIYLSQFYALYWYVFAAGGYYFDDSTYAEGQGTRWAITSYDDEDYEMIVDKALLKTLEDGSKWWKFRFTDSDGDMELLYEVKTDPAHQVVVFRFRDNTEDQAGEYTLKPDEVVSMNPGETYVITEDEYTDWIQGKEKVKTPAGTFNTDYIMTSYSDGANEWSYNWWVADKVPGGLVKFKWTDAADEWYQGELVEITSKNAPELGSLE